MAMGTPTSPEGVAHDAPSSAPPLVPAPVPGLGDRITRWAIGAALRTTLVFSPRPAAMLVRHVFARGGAATKEILDRHAPAGVETTTDVRYLDEPDCLLDVARPADTTGPLPLVVWVHGGGWIGGTKDELLGYARLIAHDGYVVVTPDYGRAPEHRYPAPPRQVAAALSFVLAEPDRFGIDPTRLVLAGDSAGAQVAAQVAAIVTTPGYAELMGIPSPIEAGQLRAAVLACGPYDLALATRSGTPTGRRLIDTVLWAYSGSRRIEGNSFESFSVSDHLTGAYPPTLLTVGNADPLRAHSELLADRLADAGVPVETVFWPAEHQPPLGHEYQFDLDGEAAWTFLERFRDFLRGHTGPDAGRA